MKTLVLVLAALTTNGLALAADPSTMQPGQYEYNIKMEMPGMPFAMPAQTVKHCLTQADVDGGKQYQDQQNKDCEIKNMKQSAGKVSFDMACKGGTTGSAEYSYTATSMTGKTMMNHDGQPMNMSMSAKRIGDCPKK